MRLTRRRRRPHGRPLRVLALIDKTHPAGGAERTMTALALHLPRDRFAVSVATTRPDHGPLLTSLRDAGIAHVAVDRRSRADVVRFRRLVAFLRREQVDVLHAHMFGSNLWGSVLGRLAGVPVVIAHEHGWSYEGRPLRKLLDGRVIARLADAVVAVSERDRERMVRAERMPAAKIVVLPAPYVARPRPERRAPLRARLGISAGAPVVATVAVLRPEKALEVLLDAVALVAAREPRIRLLVGGDGPRRAALEAHAERVGVAAHVHFLGAVDDVAGVLEAADVAAMSSDTEGSPLFAAECVAHGTPLVSTDVGDLATALGEGVTVVPRRDPEALAAALDALLRDPARRRAQAAAATRRRPPAPITTVAAEVGRLYERLVADAAARDTTRERAWRSTAA